MVGCLICSRRLAFRKDLFLWEFGFDDSSRISEGRKALGIQMVETILRIGLH